MVGAVRPNGGFGTVGKTARRPNTYGLVKGPTGVMAMDVNSACTERRPDNGAADSSGDDSSRARMAAQGGVGRRDRDETRVNLRRRPVPSRSMKALQRPVGASLGPARRRASGAPPNSTGLDSGPVSRTRQALRRNDGWIMQESLDGDLGKNQPGLGNIGRILSALRFNEGWFPAPYQVRGRLFAGMTKGFPKASVGRARA